MGPVSEAVFSSVGDSIIVDAAVHTGGELTAKAADDLLLDGAIKKVVPLHSARLETTGVKTLIITLRYKHTITDASLGFYRSSLHQYAFSRLSVGFGLVKCCLHFDTQGQLVVHHGDRVLLDQQGLVLSLSLRERTEARDTTLREA